ncbi:O-antigen translocase [Vibrio sp. PID17_43]|uniref:O-antigen translocase n=1 Tax=Vibrio sp. PID17_43 TaxID=1583451 RepID=UPI000BFFC2C1|nr:O-antigen translocase [Vibrio sp. PID17_43]PHJ40204.1 lipopolysaccharide biosynthesis protein [Vibrio sp. PID17_43]
MNLAKTSLLSFIATAIKLIAGLVINKAIALFIGPAGLAVIGQFQNAQGIIRSISQGGINSGVTKYTAEFRQNENTIVKLWSTAIKITIVLSLSVSAAIFIGADYFGKIVFGSEEYSYVFVVFSFTLILYSTNQLLLSIINGMKEISTYISINITQSIYSLIFTTALVYFFHLDGALIALVTNQSFIFFIILWKLRNHKVVKLINFRAPFNSKVSKKLALYSIMTLVSASVVPLSQMMIRNYIGETLSWDDAGYWQAMMYISTMYLMVITTALSTYYLPRLSEISDIKELKLELLKGYKVITPIILALTFTVYTMKEIVLYILFTEDFRPMLELFKWQLVGDFLKIMSWLLAYLMLAKTMTREFIITEIFFSMLFVLLSVFYVDNFGLVGVSYAFAANYGIYFISMFILMRRRFFKNC